MRQLWPHTSAAATGLGNVTLQVHVTSAGDTAEAIAAEIERVVQRHFRRSAVV
jgi:hypothetical protein